MGLVTATYNHGHICCGCLPTETRIALILGIFMHSSFLQLLFLNSGIDGLVQATVGIGTVLIWDCCLAYTRGGGAYAHFGESAIIVALHKSCISQFVFLLHFAQFCT